MFPDQRAKLSDPLGRYLPALAGFQMMGRIVNLIFLLYICIPDTDGFVYCSACTGQHDRGQPGSGMEIKTELINV